MLTTGWGIDGIFTALIFDSFVIIIISMVYLIYNIVRKNKSKIKDDIIFLLASIVIFFILAMIYGTILNSM